MPDNIPPEIAWPLIVILWLGLFFLVFKESRKRK